MSYTDEEQDYVDPFSLDASIEAPDAGATRFVFYGGEGVGKTTLAHFFPNPIICFTEKGWRNMAVRRFPQIASSYDDVCRAMGSLLRGGHDRQTFVLDTVNWFAPMVEREFCTRNGYDNIEAPGYGKGYKLVDEIWSEWFDGLNALQESGMHVVLLAHASVTSFDPPDGEKYNKYDIALHERPREKLFQWADVVGFCHERTLTTSRTEGSGNSKRTTHKGAGYTGRYLALQSKPAYRAKNGYGLPAELPLNEGPETAAQLLDLIADAKSVGR